MARNGGSEPEPGVKLLMLLGLPEGADTRSTQQLAQVPVEQFQREVPDGEDGVAAESGDQEAVEDQQVVRTLSQNGYGNMHTHTHCEYKSDEDKTIFLEANATHGYR